MADDTDELRPKEKPVPKPRGTGAPFGRTQIVLVETDETPKPCERCGKSSKWWDVGGREHCLKCDPPIATTRLLMTKKKINDAFEGRA